MRRLSLLSVNTNSNIRPVFIASLGFIFVSCLIVGFRLRVTDFTPFSPFISQYVGFVAILILNLSNSRFISYSIVPVIFAFGSGSSILALNFYFLASIAVSFRKGFGRLTLYRLIVSLYSFL